MMNDYFARLKKFFREEPDEVVGAYFDGEKIFIARLTEKFETIEVDADGTQKGWKTSAVVYKKFFKRVIHWT